MALPLAIGWGLRAGAKLLTAWKVPVFAALAAWVLEKSVGAISWGLFVVGSALLDGVLFAVGAAPVPAGGLSASSWAEFSPHIIAFGSLTGFWVALGVYLGSVGLRLVAWAVTLGRF